MPDERVCLVLSVGGSEGVAHLGAIEAIRDANVQVDCVAGTSMGAVVGALYAAQPSDDTTTKFVEFAREYVRTTEEDAGGRGVVGALGGAILAAATGGSGLLLTAAGAGVGASSTGKVDHERFVKVLNHALRSKNIEDVDLPFGYHTYYLDMAGELDIEHLSSGNMAQAVGKSAANPLIFPDLQPAKTGVLDPAVDRVSSTPIDDTCAALHEGAPPRTRFTLLAINVTSRAAYYKDTRCRVVKVRPEVERVPTEAAYLFGPAFEVALSTGYAATCNALPSAGLGTCNSPTRARQPIGPMPYRVEILDARFAPQKANGQPWDGDGSEPDPTVTLVVDGWGRGRVTAPKVDNSRTPRWNGSGHVTLVRGDRLRIQVTDMDALFDDPAAVVEVEFEGPKTYVVKSKDGELEQLRFRISDDDAR